MFQFNITPEKLIVSACNQSQQITTSADCKSDFTGCYLFPAKEVLGLVKSLTEQPINFDVLQHTTPATEHQPERINYSTVIRYNKGKVSLPLQYGDAMPTIKCEPTTNFTIPADDFLEAIFRTSYACSTDRERTNLSGVAISGDGKYIKFTACDSLILGTHTLKIQSKTFFMAIPKSTLSLIESLQPSGEVIIELGKNVQFSFNDISVKALLLEEKVPDFNQVIPIDNSIISCISANELKSSLSRLKPFCNKHNQQVELRISAYELILKAADSDFEEEAIEELAIESDGDIIIGTNINWLISTMSRITTEICWISFKSESTAIIFSEHKPDKAKDNLMLVMPQKIL